jgi:hypothetical protein
MRLEIVWTIKMKQRSHRKGPGVEPWPGPKSGAVSVDEYFSAEIPYLVFTKCTALSQLVPNEEVAEGEHPKHNSCRIRRVFTRWSYHPIGSFSIMATVSLKTE